MFESYKMFKLKGTISCWPNKTNHAGDPSTLDPSPGGNWSIWPFSLRRSGSRDSLPPIPNDAKNTTFGNSSENKIFTDVSKNETMPNLVKRKVRETTPTSEQLASLNLKEGRNIITFTFSTAMLGKQQVNNHEFLQFNILKLTFPFMYVSLIGISQLLLFLLFYIWLTGWCSNISVEMEWSYSDLRCGWNNYKVSMHIFKNR